MRLILNVTSSKHPLSERGKRVEFDRHGGSIGRAQDNTCVLPDPERFISSQHALIRFQDDAYLLTDTSVNGVYLNDSGQPVGENNTVTLRDGDCLMMGDYELRVAIEPVNQQGGAGRQENGIQPDYMPPPVTPWGVSDEQEGAPGILDGNEKAGVMPGFSDWDKDDSPVKPRQLPATEPDHVPVEKVHFTPAGIRPKEKLSDWDRTEFTSSSDDGVTTPPKEGVVDDTMAPGDATGSSPDWDRTEFTLPEDQPGGSPPDLFEDGSSGVLSAAAGYPEKMQGTGENKHSDVPDHIQATSPAAGDAAQVSPAHAPMVPGSGVELAQAFLEAAGLDNARITPEAAPDLMRLFGGLYREIVTGLMDVLRARSSLKNEFRMQHTMISAKENNPLKFSGRVEEAIEHLVFNRGSGFLPPEAAFKEAFQDVADHQTAMVVGMRAAFESLLRRFDPEQLQQRVNKGKKIGNLLPVNRKASCWERYEELYADIAAAAEDDFQGLFGDEFTRAYEEQVARLSLSRKKTDR